jgi:fused signal recognition particle receptor
LKIYSMSKPESDQNPPSLSRFKQMFKRNKHATDDADPEQGGAPVMQEPVDLANATVEPDLNTTEDQLAQTGTKFDSATSVDDVDIGLSKSRTGLLAKIGHVFKGSFALDDELFEELEDALISSDVGIDASLALVEALRARIKQNKLQTAQEVRDALVAVTAQSLAAAEQNWVLNTIESKKPYVILVVGVNGVGKTTTTAKIARHLQEQGQAVMLAAADTFRAAAVEQLQNWGQQLGIPVIAQGHGADAAAVAHDAYTSALAKNIDVLIIDTAGRLHTQDELMQQLDKVQRVIRKMNPEAPHEVMQILDAGTGQNALTQLEAFRKAVGVSSVCMTKLDGSAKGGMALAITSKFQLPIRFIGVGEKYTDLKPFKAQAFAAAMIPSLNELQNN